MIKFLIEKEFKQLLRKGRCTEIGGCTDLIHKAARKYAVVIIHNIQVIQEV